MNQHYSEADLLETYYTQPGQSLPVMMHLADCSECAARYERLERKIRGLAACSHDEKPETFWARQRISIMRKVERQPKATPSIARITRVAAAAAFVLALGGGVLTWDRKEVAPAVPSSTAVATTTETTTQPAATEVVSVSSDPWESEELDEFGSLVAWESWDEKTDGDQS
jgi:anti-sigma factor RsiW